MYKFLGVRRYDFVPKDSKDGKPRKGYNFWFMDDEDSQGEYFAGVIPFKLSCTVEQAESIFSSFGDKDFHVMEEYAGKWCEVAFNRFGKIQAIRFIED